jgi:hypothetical protein
MSPVENQEQHASRSTLETLSLNKLGNYASETSENITIPCGNIPEDKLNFLTSLKEFFRYKIDDLPC